MQQTPRRITAAAAAPHPRRCHPPPPRGALLLPSSFLRPPPSALLAVSEGALRLCAHPCLTSLPVPILRLAAAAMVPVYR